MMWHLTVEGTCTWLIVGTTAFRSLQKSFLRKFGKRGRGDGELDYTVSVAIDSDDVVYVVEAGNHHISLFTSEGHFIWHTI